MRSLNVGIYDRIMRMHVQMHMLDRALGIEVYKRLNAAATEIRGKVLAGAYPGPYQTTASLATDDLVAALISIRSWFFDQLRKAAADIHKQVPYLLTGRKPRTESLEEMWFLEAEKDEEEESDLLDSLLLLMQQWSLAEIYFYMLESWRWKGFTILEQWENLILNQRRVLYQVLVQTGATVGADENSFVVDSAVRGAMADQVRQRIIGNGGPQTTVGVVASVFGTQLSDVANKIVSTTAARNGRFFSGERWHSVLEPATCARCANLHGRWFPSRDGSSTAPPIPYHLRCKCSLAPELRGEGPVPVEKFSEWLKRQPEDFQKSWLGATRYELLKSGQFSLKNFVEFRNGVPVRQYRLDELK